MNKSQWRIRPGFLAALLLLALLDIFISSLIPNGGGKRKAQIIFTHFETKEIATVLRECSIKSGGFTNIDNNLIFQAVFGTNGDINLNYHPGQTNQQGQVLDCWETPYQIKSIARTNFVVSSAGPNKIFGDADDIIFNSVSNDFVKP